MKLFRRFNHGAKTAKVFSASRPEFACNLPLTNHFHCCIRRRSRRKASRAGTTTTVARSSHQLCTNVMTLARSSRERYGSSVEDSHNMHQAHQHLQRNDMKTKDSSETIRPTTAGVKTSSRSPEILTFTPSAHRRKGHETIPPATAGVKASSRSKGILISTPSVRRRKGHETIRPTTAGVKASSRSKEILTSTPSVHRRTGHRKGHRKGHMAESAENITVAHENGANSPVSLLYEHKHT